MEINVDSIREQIPYYLTEDQKEGLVRALKDFPIGTNYYLNGYQDELLQGDGWNKLQFRRFETGEKEAILGVVLSNTCDMSPDNKRDLPVNITFAPLIPLPAYVRLLERSGVEPHRIGSKVTSIKEQKVTSIFFLPAGGGLKEDHIVLFDQIHTMPAKVFELESQKRKVFTLSLVGFYLFILKISVHLCRFNDKVVRV